jgi:hypothetical protein
MKTSSKMTGHKVTPSAKVPPPASEIQNNPLNSDLAGNPSQKNGNNPPASPTDYSPGAASPIDYERRRLT